MYNLVFEQAGGKTFSLGAENDIVFDLSDSGTAVKLSTTQGAGQTGDTIETEKIHGITIKIKGRLFGDIARGKRYLCRAFSPSSRGRLIFDGKYFLNVAVKNSPAFSPAADKGKFALQLFAPFPFWRAVSEVSDTIGKITPAFRFPVSYAQPHRFGVVSEQKYINVVNDGDLPAPYELLFIAKEVCTAPFVQNLRTRRKIRFNASLLAGDTLHVYRDDRGILRAVQMRGSTPIDAIYTLSDDSDLFDLDVGDNLLLADAKSGAATMQTRIAYHPVYGGIYEI